MHKSDVGVGKGLDLRKGAGFACCVFFEIRVGVLLVVERGDLERAPIPVFHFGAESRNDPAAAAAADGAKAAFDQVVFLVLHDAAVVHVAVDGDNAITFGKQFDDTVSSRFDPAGIVGRDAVKVRPVVVIVLHDATKILHDAVAVRHDAVRYDAALGNT